MPLNSRLPARSVELSALVDERRVKELPLNGRNFLKLVQLAPGVGDTGLYNNPSINGSRIASNSYTVDGVGSNDERIFTGFVGVNDAESLDLGPNSPNLISTEAVQEYRIITSNADATFGRDRAATSTWSRNRGATSGMARLMSTIATMRWTRRTLFTRRIRVRSLSPRRARPRPRRSSRTSSEVRSAAGSCATVTFSSAVTKAFCRSA
jgi:hypothetical protein